MRTLIVTITYNVPDLLIHQAELLRKYCAEDAEILVVDNSTEQDAIEGIRHHAERLGCQYMKTNASSRGGSLSHAFAANVSYQKAARDYDQVLYLDHDCFPILPFSIAGILGDNIAAGVGQTKIKTYLWPGLLFLNNKEVDTNIVDFSPSPGLDTGGNLYKLIETYPDRINYLNEMYEENPYYTEPPYNYYSILAAGAFMHFVNSSNWTNTVSDATNRINCFINALTDKTK